MRRSLILLTLTLTAACGATSSATPDAPAAGALDCPDGAFVPGPRPGLGHCETATGQKIGPAIEEAPAFGSNVIGIGIYVDGQRHGPWNFSRGEADVATGPFSFGERDGTWRFGPVAEPTAEGKFAEGEPVGAWQYRCGDGQRCLGEYEAGKQVEWRWTMPADDESESVEYVVHLVGPLWRRELRVGDFVRAWHIVEDPKAWMPWVPGATVEIPDGWRADPWPTACDGPFRFFHAPDRTAQLGECRAGAPEGDIRAYAPNGVLIREEQWVDSQRHGVQRWYDADGTLRRVEHRAKGRLEGPLEVYGPDEVKLVAGDYYEGEPVGSWTVRWPSGERRAEGAFTAVDAIQECLAAAEDDGLEQCEALRGQPTGTWKYWHPNGKPMATVKPDGEGWSVDYRNASGKRTELSGSLDIEAPDSLAEQIRSCLGRLPSDWAGWQHGESVLRFARVDDRTTVTSDPDRFPDGIEECLVDVQPGTDIDVAVVFGEPHPASKIEEADE